MKNIIVLIYVLLFSFASYAQKGHYIGLHKTRVIEEMEKNMPDFILARVINPAYNYLKYQDDMGEQTILFFLDEEDVCTAHRFMSHYIHLGQEITRLNREFSKVNEQQWEYSRNGEGFIIDMKKEQWYFSLFTKPKNN
jgi:hypothetical protein